MNLGEYVRADFIGPYSYSDEFGNGGASQGFTLSFVGPSPGYIRQSDVQVWVRVSDKEDPSYGKYERMPIETSITFSSESSIVVSPAPEVSKDGNSNVRVRRIMPKEFPYFKIPSDAIFRKEVLNNSFLQQLYSQHEVLDGFMGGAGGFTSDINMNGFLLFNLREGTEPDHSVRKSQLDALAEHIDNVIPDITPLVERAEKAANDAEDTEEDINLTYAGSRDKFPSSWSREGAWMYLNTVDPSFPTAAIGSYVYSSAYIANNGWMSSTPVTRSGVMFFDAIGDDDKDFLLPLSPMDVLFSIDGLNQIPKKDFSLDGNRIVMIGDTVPKGTSILVQMYTSIGFASNVTLKGSKDGDDIIALTDQEVGDAWIVANPQTTDWDRGDAVVWDGHMWNNIGPYMLRGPKGDAGEDGKGWTSGSYDPDTGIVTFESDDALGFTTEDLRGTDGVDGSSIINIKDKLTGAEIEALTSALAGDLYINSDGADIGGVAFEVNDTALRTYDSKWINAGKIQGPVGEDGENGKGWTAGTYDSATGIITFSSDDGLGFSTGDVRGKDGKDGKDGSVSDFLSITYEVTTEKATRFPAKEGTDPNSELLVFRDGIAQQPKAFTIERADDTVPVVVLAEPITDSLEEITVISLTLLTTAIKDKTPIFESHMGD